jgi:hypothetical protein
MTFSLLAAAVLAAGAAGTPGAGAGIGAGPVCLASPAQPGGTYQPGDVYVTDPGGSAVTLDLSAGPLWPGQQLYRGELAVSPSWVRFSPAAVTLRPGQGAPVPVTLAVPVGARRGIYVADILAAPQAGPALSGSGQHASLAGAAQAFLIFTVGPVEPAPSCTLPPAQGSPWAARYAPRQPQEATVPVSWLRSHLPWVFGGHAPALQAAAAQPAAAAASPPDLSRAGYGVLAGLAVLAAAAAAWRRRRHRGGGQQRRRAS